jgi:hypothetical protein
VAKQVHLLSDNHGRAEQGAEVRKNRGQHNSPIASTMLAYLFGRRLTTRILIFAWASDARRCSGAMSSYRRRNQNEYAAKQVQMLSGNRGSGMQGEKTGLVQFWLPPPCISLSSLQ